MYKKIKTLFFPLAKLAFNTYNLKPRNYTYNGITVRVNKQVFPPQFTISTKLLLKFLDTLPLQHKTFLELGCGSGIVSLYAASKGAMVTATDINKIAVELLKIAAKNNNLELDVLYSDLFENIKHLHFDYIIINPPYYPKNPKNTKEQAWFCGENFEYFVRLFSELNTHIANHTYMILSEDCDINYIKKIANNQQIQLNLIQEKTVLKEENYIFKIVKI